MRIGVYVDGYNLYYGGRGLCGRRQAGWRWLDVRALSESLLTPDWRIAGAHIERIVYCTARISGSSNPISEAEQDVYLKALVGTNAVDQVAYGVFVERVKNAPLAVADAKGRPVLTTSAWPVMIQDAAAVDVPNARFMVSVAPHLLVDVLDGDVDAAIVISNDSDLAFPLATARARVPVGTVNPSRTYLAGKAARPTRRWRRASLVASTQRKRLDGESAARSSRRIRQAESVVALAADTAIVKTRCQPNDRTSPPRLMRLEELNHPAQCGPGF